MNVRREAPTPMSTGFPICSQCGKVHPALPKGEICPVAASTKTDPPKEDNLVKDIVCLLQMDQKGVLRSMLEKTIRAWKIMNNNKK